MTTTCHSLHFSSYRSLANLLAVFKSSKLEYRYVVRQCHTVDKQLICLERFESTTGVLDFQVTVSDKGGQQPGL